MIWNTSNSKSIMFSDDCQYRLQLSTNGTLFITASQMSSHIWSSDSNYTQNTTACTMNFSSITGDLRIWNNHQLIWSAIDIENRTLYDSPFKLVMNQIQIFIKDINDKKIWQSSSSYYDWRVMSYKMNEQFIISNESMVNVSYDMYLFTYVFSNNLLYIHLQINSSSIESSDVISNNSLLNIKSWIMENAEFIFLANIYPKTDASESISYLGYNLPKNYTLKHGSWQSMTVVTHHTFLCESENSRFFDIGLQLFSNNRSFESDLFQNKIWSFFVDPC